MTSMTGDQTPPAGWYPDPNPGADAPAGQQRYWDGSAWTDQTTTAPTGPADPAAVQQAPRDGLGLAAFVLGVIGLILVFFIPVGILVTGILGIIGLILGFLGRGRAKRGEATNGRTALWGIILSALAVAISVIAAVRLVADLGEADLGEEASQETAPPGAEVVNVFDLEVGDCLTEVQAIEEEILSVQTVPCSEPHREEIYAVVTLPEGDFPGDEAIVTQAEDVCLAEFEGFVGLSYAESVLEFNYAWPLEEGWDAGERGVVCAVSDPDGDTTGTLADANR
jgi:Septum formation/Protein of unknown function (DUF2510)